MNKETLASLVENLRLYYEQNDLVALRQFFKDYQPTAIRVAFSVLKNQPDAEDCVQQVFLSIIKASSKCKAVYSEDYAAAKSWLFTIIYNAARLQMRNNSRTVGLEESWIEPSVEEPQGYDERADKVKDVLLQLPEKYRVPLLMRYKEDFSIEEICEMLSKKPGTIRSLISRGLEKIRTRLTVDAPKLTSALLISLIAKESYCAANDVLDYNQMDLLVEKAAKVPDHLVLTSSSKAAKSSFSLAQFVGILSVMAIPLALYYNYQNSGSESIEKVEIVESSQKTKWDFSVDKMSDLIIKKGLSIQASGSITNASKDNLLMFEVPYTIKGPIKITLKSELPVESKVNAVEAVLYQNGEVVMGKMMHQELAKFYLTQPKEKGFINTNQTIYLLDNMQAIQMQNDNLVKVIYLNHFLECKLGFLVLDYKIYSIQIEELDNDEVSKIKKAIQAKLNQ